MTESYYTRPLLKLLRSFLPENIIFKLSDTFTMGIPDIMINVDGLTTFFECKYFEDPTFVENNTHVMLDPKKIPPIQWEVLRRLKRGWLVVFTEEGHGVVPVTVPREEARKIKLFMMPLEALARFMIDVSRRDKYDIH